MKENPKETYFEREHRKVVPHNPYVPHTPGNTPSSVKTVQTTFMVSGSPTNFVLLPADTSTGTVSDTKLKENNGSKQCVNGDKKITNASESTIYSGPTALRVSNMTRYFSNKEDAARFVSARLRNFQSGSLSITITRPEKSSGFFVEIVTGILSDASAILKSSKGLDVT